MMNKKLSIDRIDYFRVPIPKREFLTLFPFSLLTACAIKVNQTEEPMAKVASFVRKDAVWKIDNFLDFLSALPPQGLLALKISLEILPIDATENALKGSKADVLEIATSLCQAASWFRQCSKPADYDYHALVVELAKSAKVDSVKLQGASTYDCEQMMMAKVFAELEAAFVVQWNKMSVEERKKVLEAVDPNGELKDRASLVLADGRMVINAVSALIKTGKFSSYLTATSALKVASTTVGVTPSFRVYSSMTRLMSLIVRVSLPVSVIAAVFGIAFMAQPSARKVTGFVMTMHGLKIDALMAAGMEKTS